MWLLPSPAWLQDERFKRFHSALQSVNEQLTGIYSRLTGGHGDAYCRPDGMVIQAPSLHGLGMRLLMCCARFSGGNACPDALLQACSSLSTLPTFLPNASAFVVLLPCL